MASETIQQDTNVCASLPFSDLDGLKFGHVISGPRMSLPRYHASYGCITIRNYLAGHTKKSLRLKAKRVSDLKAFVELPVELQILVLEHLHPIDLYHLSQASRNFRRLALDPAVLPVWKAAFMRHPKLPTPPPGVKEPEWAFMIYGPGICGVCGKYGALTDFSFRKRFCGSCMDAHALCRRDFRSESNKPISSHHVIWELIPYTYRCSGIRYSAGSARFLKTDFSFMWKKLKLIHILQKNGLRSLSPLFANYIATRKKYIQKLHDTAGKSNHWAYGIICQVSNEYDELFHRLASKCKTRLRALGYDERDIASAFYSIQKIIKGKAIHRLTRRVFREIKPRIEVILMKCRNDRIKDERQRRLLDIYRDYLKARSSDEWPNLPDVKVRSFLDTKYFTKLLKPPFDESLDITPGIVLPALPGFIEKWVKTRQEELADLLPNDPNETWEARVQRLELVTSVLTCRTCAFSSCLPLIGWKSICRHQLNCGESCRSYVICQNAVASATSLVSCVGLDPLTTTVDDMDCRNDRFVCGNCSPEVYRGRLSRRVYTWLECLQHMIDNFPRGIDVDHANPVCLPLSPAMARFVRASEKPYPDASISVWRCNLCAHHFEEQIEQAGAIDHVKEVHCIRTPAIGVDVVADPRNIIRKRREVFRLSDPAHDHICKHCSDMPIIKFWEKSILMKHLIKRHHVPEPAEHVDWESVPIFAPSVAPVTTSVLETVI